MKESEPNLPNTEMATTPVDHGDGPAARSQSVPSPTTRPQPTIRLGTVSVLSNSDRQRLVLLLEQLIERRVARHFEGERI